MEPIASRAFRQQIENELVKNILPFWIRHAVDDENGGFYGAVTNDLQVIADAPKGAVLCARILWTYATAYRILGKSQYLQMARRAYDYITRFFWDRTYGGVYWMLDYYGNPLSDRKQVYAQAFTIYALAEYYWATQDAESLSLAQKLFRQVEAHSYDSVHQGYVEACSREWGLLDDMRLDVTEPHCHKSMNTLLHLMEAYTNLMRVWDDKGLRVKQRELIQIFLERVIDPRTHHFKLFFDDQWRSISDNISFGHDIEGSWLLVEAAEVSGAPDLLAQAQETAVKMAQAVYVEGLEADGGIIYEANPQGVVEFDKQWWSLAEAVVGFFNAYQISSREHFYEAAHRCWNYIINRVIDRTYGGWFKKLDRYGRPYADHPKVGPWEGPYHHSRTCFEMMSRLGL